MYSIGQNKIIPPAFNGQQPIKRDKAVAFTGGVDEAAKHILQKSGLERMGENLAGKFSDKAIQSGWFRKFLDFSVQANKNASWFEACMVLGLATTLRPASIMALPGAKKEDKQYAAAKSIATGIIGFCVAALIYLPLAAVMKKSGDAALKMLEKNAGKGIFPALGTKAYDSFNFIINYGSKFIVGPLDAMLLFKLIPPVMHKVFPNKNAKKDPNVNPLPVMAANLNEDQQKVFAALMQKSAGGVK